MMKSDALMAVECMRTEINILMRYGAKMDALGRIIQTFLTQPLIFMKEAKRIARV